MVNRTLDEWSEYYKNKTGIAVDDKPYKRLKYFPEMGFMYYSIVDDKMVICETTGNGKFWFDVAKQTAKENHCKAIHTVIYCNPKAYQRLFPGAKIAGTVMKLEV